MNGYEANAGRGGLTGRLRGFHRSQSGQAIFVVVVFFFLLAGLTFMVLNGGEKLYQKVQMQSAADASTATGAAWYARGLNTVSLCNVTETQLLSLICLCDTLETVTPPAKECIDELVAKIGESKAGKDIPIDPGLADPNAGYGSGTIFGVIGNAAAEKEIITQLSDIVKAVQWPDYLEHDSGVLWQCMMLVDAFQHAMAKDTPLAAQREAMDTAKKNEAEFGFVVPLWPELPVVDGTWVDFKPPMQTGHLPRAYDNGAEIGGFRWVMSYLGYNGQLMGPWGYWREPFVRARPLGLFDLSRFSVMFDRVSRMKLDMMFDGAAPVQFAVDGKFWEMDYDKAKKVPEAEIDKVWWQNEGFSCRYPTSEETPAFPPPGMGPWGALIDSPQPTPGRHFSTANMRNQPPTTGQYPFVRATESYQGADPREAVWYQVRRSRSPNYPALGIICPHPPPYTEADMHTYWHVTLRRFNGLQKKGDQPLHRKYVGPGSEKYAPLMFTNDVTNTQANADNIAAHFTFDGFAYRPGAVHLWASGVGKTQPNAPSGEVPITQLKDTLGFVNPNPIDKLVAYAEARVYNRYSWDTFTQHWKVKLVRMSRWDLIPSEIDQGLGQLQGGLGSEFTEERLKAVREMLETYPADFVQGTRGQQPPGGISH